MSSKARIILQNSQQGSTVYTLHGALRIISYPLKYGPLSIPTVQVRYGNFENRKEQKKYNCSEFITLAGSEPETTWTTPWVYNLAIQ